jgi:hypothetical protein
MGGSTRDGCSKLNSGDNETLRSCFHASADPTKDLCAHCNVYRVMKKNITKKLQHISVCASFKVKCTGEDVDARSFQGFRNRAIRACEGYSGNSVALEAASELNALRKLKLVAYIRY